MLRIHIHEIQHVKDLVFEIDLSNIGLTCIVGRNGTGKTTLVRAIRNIVSADTFSQTASPYIFSPDSRIDYQLNEYSFSFHYREEIETLDSRDIIPREVRNSIEVELPIPDGIRFNHFRQLSFIDERLRTAISLGEYEAATELISFLNRVYAGDKFAELKEVEIGKAKYYFILKDGDYYIREDYLSSGEYFLIHLFKLIELGKKIIVVDEIDISLDAAAQANLIVLLREISKERGINIIFTTHSLALMKTLESGELLLMTNEDGTVHAEAASYNFVKSILFGFIGWDKYVLTEDVLLEGYLQYLIDNSGVDGLCQYRVLSIGTADSVTRLMRTNDQQGFFGAPNDVICLLDGDKQGSEDVKADGDNRVYFLPFANIESHLYELAVNGHPKLPKVGGYQPKPFYQYVMNEFAVTQGEIFEIITASKNNEISALTKQLITHLSI